MTGLENGGRWHLEDHERRIATLERYDIAVVVNRLAYLERRVDGMTRALWATAGSLVIAAVTFALAVASGQIG